MTPRWRRAALVALLASLSCLGGVIWSVRRVTTARLLDLENETRLVAVEAAARLATGVNQQRTAIAQIVKLLPDGAPIRDREFDNLVSALFSLAPQHLRVYTIDRAFHITHVYPREANRFLIGFDIRTHPPTYRTVIRSVQDSEPSLSSPMELVGGGHGFVLASPVSKAGRLLGALVTTFENQTFIASAFSARVRERYEGRALASGQEVFATPSFDTLSPSAPTVVEAFALAGSLWEVQVRPGRQLLQSTLRTGQGVVWTLGSLLALAAGAAAAAATLWVSAFASRVKTQSVALRETREQLDGAKQQLLHAEKLGALGELVAGVAHEINNPLSSILGYAQILLMRNPAPEFRRRLEVVVSEAERMAKIVSNLLTFARKQAAEKRYLGLNGIITKTLELRAYGLRVNQIDVGLDLIPDLPMTMLDFHQMQQVFLNLISNAEQALIERGKGGSIRVSTRRADGMIESRISDTGPGIPAEIQGRIFEPFFTTKKEGKGTGLGLSLCYGIIQEHGGTIRVESRPGQGATFVITLPIVADTGDVTTESPRHSPIPQRLRLLIVDDEHNILNFLVDAFSAKGHRVDTASDVPEALRKIRKGGHDLIISDMRMPHGSGRDVHRAASERSPALGRRIVFTTGDGSSAETMAFIQGVGAEVVLKPFKIEEIERAVARALQR